MNLSSKAYARSTRLKTPDPHALTFLFNYLTVCLGHAILGPWGLGETVMIEFLADLDRELLRLANAIVGHSQAIDQALRDGSRDSWVKSGLSVAVLMLAWVVAIGQGEAGDRLRCKIFGVIAAMVAAIATGRALALLMPFRLRPVHSPDIVLTPPLVPIYPPGADWSSLPSDHAVMFAAVATGILFIHRGLGLLVWAQVAIFVMLPRVAAGLHWPFDVMLGAVIGAGIAVFAAPCARRWIENTGLAALCRRRMYLSTFAFLLVLHQMSHMFDQTRATLSGVWSALIA